MSDYPQLRPYIGGEWKTADGAPVINSADEGVLGTGPHAPRADLDDALAAAEDGFRIWSRTAPSKRAEIPQAPKFRPAKARFTGMDRDMAITLHSRI